MNKPDFSEVNTWKEVLEILRWFKNKFPNEYRGTGYQALLNDWDDGIIAPMMLVSRAKALDESIRKRKIMKERIDNVAQAFISLKANIGSDEAFAATEADIQTIVTAALEGEPYDRAWLSDFNQFTYRAGKELYDAILGQDEKEVIQTLSKLGFFRIRREAIEITEDSTLVSGDREIILEPGDRVEITENINSIIALEKAVEEYLSSYVFEDRMSVGFDMALVIYRALMNSGDTEVAALMSGFKSFVEREF